MLIINRDNGFTLCEIVIASATIMLIASLFGIFTSNRDKTREAEVIANVHTIQVAIERYEVDHKRYPSFLLGGDPKGWRNWHMYNDDPELLPDEPSNNLVQDVLVQYGYLESYPQNPFVSDGMKVIMSTRARGTGPGGKLRAGDGDPRFGYNGNIMGNGIDDPAYYKHRIAGIPPVETTLIETRRTLDDRTVRELGFCEPPKGLHYMMGGRKAFDDEGNVITVATWWPGNFYYRGLFDHPLERKGWTWNDSWEMIGAGGTKMNRYILGGYGSLTTVGYDVVRLESRNWDNTDYIFYRLPAPWYKCARNSGIRCSYKLPEGSNRSECGLPELCGGGDGFTGPFYPYNQGDNTEGFEYGKFIYGAPDGHPDGVIVMLTDNGGGINTWE